MTAVVILAAGMGRRFAGPGHKALAPVLGDRGTLELLLEQVRTLDDMSGVTVVSGRHREAVEGAVRQALPTARTVHNPAYDTTGPLQSLACAIDEDSAEDILVLLADTVYDSDFLLALAGLMPQGSDAPPVAQGRARADASALGCAVFVQRSAATDAIDESRVPVAVEDGIVVGIGAGPSQYEMAPAVLWGAESLGWLRSAAHGAARKQWHAIAGLIALGEPLAGRLPAIEVPATSSRDVDTEADLAAVRALLA